MILNIVKILVAVSNPVDRSGAGLQCGSGFDYVLTGKIADFRCLGRFEENPQIAFFIYLFKFNRYC
jgi:hypothetical protein